MTKENIDARTLRDMLERDERVTVVDVRKKEAHAEESIPGSVNFDAYDALHAGDERAMEGLELPEGARIVTVCNRGHSSALPPSSCGVRDTRHSSWREEWKPGRASEAIVVTLCLRRSPSGEPYLGYSVDPAVRAL